MKSRLAWIVAQRGPQLLLALPLPAVERGDDEREAQHDGEAQARHGEVAPVPKRSRQAGSAPGKGSAVAS